MAVLLFIGDICGRPGRQILKELLPTLKKQHRPLLVMANGENSAGGIGITPDTADEIFSFGVDVLTSGNHIWKKRGIIEYLNKNNRLIRPANYPPGVPGNGMCVVETPAGLVAVINVQGRVFMPPIDCPFRTCDHILNGLSNEIIIKAVDFHAEATSEKQAMGWYLDGRVGVVIGTHTHVQTADERILPRGTGYITDAGMTGATESVIGMEPGVALSRLLSGVPEPFQVAKKKVELQGIVVDVDEGTGKCRDIKRIKLGLV